MTKLIGLTKTYKIKLKSTTPVVWNVIKKELEEEKKKLKKDEFSEWEEKNWRRKAAFDNKGRVIFPSQWFKSSLINACKISKMVPSFANKKSETYTRYVGNFLIDDIPPVAQNKNKLSYYGNYLSSQGLMKSGKVWRVRPLIKSWETSFHIIDPQCRMIKEELIALLSYSGSYVGIGDDRIRNMGRFKVISVEEVKK